MKHHYHHYLFSLVVLLIIVVTNGLVFAQAGSTVSAEEALKRLKAGNERFVKGKYKPVDHSSDRIEWSKTQEPYAIILSCSDSRVPPEIVFDEAIGRLFIIRLAGNIVDSAVLGSVEYAAAVLHAKLVVILGHESCGAVKAAMSGGNLPANIASVTSKIKPALKPNITLDEAIDDNVLFQMKRAIDESPVLKEMVENKSIAIVGGVYDFKTGKIDWLGAAK